MQRALFVLGWLSLCSPRAYGQKPSTSLPASPVGKPDGGAREQDAESRPMTVPGAKAEGGKPTKRKKAPAPSVSTPESSAVADSHTEKTKIEPSFTYRAAALSPVKDSVYHKEEHGDFADQLYLTLRFAKTYDYVHEVLLEPTLRTFRNNPSSWEPYVIEQAYVESALLRWLNLTAGKKAEFEGSGFMVNPSDLLNEGKDIFDPLYQKEGVVFARLKLHGDTWSLGLGGIPRRGHPSRAGRAWLTASLTAWDVDLRLQATANPSEKATTGLSVQRFFGDHFELHFDGRYQRRQRDPEILGQDYLKYSAYVGPDVFHSDDDSPSGFYLAGTRFIFTSRRTLILESIQNQSGLLPDEFKRLFADLQAVREENPTKVADPPSRLRGRHYAFASYQDDDSLKKIHLAASALLNTDDQSSFATMSVRYNISPITSVELAPTFFKGKADTEFGEMPFSEAHYFIVRGRF